LKFLQEVSDTVHLKLTTQKYVGQHPILHCLIKLPMNLALIMP
jgi:hypothetical protein